MPTKVKRMIQLNQEVIDLEDKTPIVTEWQDFPSVAAGTLITGSTTNPTYGTVTHNKAQWRRVGSNMEIHWSFRQSTAGTAGSGDYFFNLPPGYSIDSTKIQFSAGLGESNLRASCGTFEAIHHGSNHLIGQMHAYDATRLHCIFQYQVFGHSTLDGSGVWSSGFGPFTNTPLTINIRASVPIQGWSASAALTTTEIGLQTVQVIAFKNGGSTTPSAAITSWTKTKDNFNCFNASTGIFTAPKPMTVFVSFTANTTVATFLPAIHVNSTIVRTGQYDAAGTTGSVSSMVPLNKDDTLFVSIDQSRTFASLNYTTHLSITEVPDFTTFAPLFDNTDVELYLDSFSAYGTTGTRIPRFSNIQKQTGSGVYYSYVDSVTDGAQVTIIVPGTYFVQLGFNTPSGAQTLGITVNDTARSTNVNALTYAQGKRAENSSGAANYTGTCSTTLRLKARDIVSPHTDGIAGSANARTYFQLIRIGN